MEPCVIVVTGASSGIGRACAEHLAAAGHRVYGTSRRAPAPDAPGPSGSPAASSDPDRASGTGKPVMVRLDVTSDASVTEAVEWVLAREGRIDVLVNNAGNGVAGPVEQTTLDEARAQLETNFFGVVRMCRAVLPSMRAQRSGLIVNVSSIGGLIAIPFQGFYSASKFALEGLTEALRTEVRAHGVRVVLVEPGDFHTGFTEARTITAEAETAGDASAYATAFRAALGRMERDETNGADPAEVARLVAKVMALRHPRLRYAVGPTFQVVSARVLRKVLPERFVGWALAHYYGLARVSRRA